MGGAAVNVIPDHGYAMYDIRSQTNPLMKEMLDKVRRCAENTAAAFGATATMTFPGDVIPACEYDDTLVQEVADCIRDVVGEENLVMTCGGGGEDFHFFKQFKPSLQVAYFGVGCGCEPGLHHPQMHFNPKALQNGVDVLEKIVLRHLG